MKSKLHHIEQSDGKTITNIVVADIPYNVKRTKFKAPKTFPVTWLDEQEMRKVVREVATLLRLIKDYYVDTCPTLEFLSNGDPKITIWLQNRDDKTIEDGL